MRFLSPKPQLLLSIPVVLFYFACNDYGFGFRAALSGSCMLIMALCYFKNTDGNRDIWYILTAFAFSIAGDWFMSHKGASFLLYSVGIGSYFLAHVAFLFFALKNGRIPKIFTLLLSASFLVFFALKLYPAIENRLLSTAVLLYLVISCLSLGAAIGINGSPLVIRSYSSGIALLFISDTLIALKDFLSISNTGFMILPTYFASHIVITFAVIQMIEAHHNILHSKQKIL